MANRRTTRCALIFMATPLPEGALLRLGTVAYRAWPLAGVGFRANGDLVAITQLFELHTWPADGKSKPTIMRLPVDARGGRAAIAPNCRYAVTEADRKLIVWDI